MMQGPSTWTLLWQAQGVQLQEHEPAPEGLHKSTYEPGKQTAEQHIAAQQVGLLVAAITAGYFKDRGIKGLITHHDGKLGGGAPGGG